MHSKFSISKTVDIYHYDHTSDHAIWAIALVHYWLIHAFKVANCNGFYFNTYPLGLSPNGTLRSESYVHNHEDLCLLSDIDAQMLYFLFSLMDFIQPNLKFHHDCCSTIRNRLS